VGADQLLYNSPMGLSSTENARRNILVVRLSSLGDVLLVAPVLRNLKAAWPGCRVSVLVKRRYAAALEGSPFADEVISFDGFFPALAKIRASGFTHLLDLHANLRSALLRRFAAVPEVSVYRKDAWARRLFVFLGRRSPRLEKHVMERYLEALGRWGIAPQNTGVALGDYSAAALGAASSGDAKSFLIVQSAFLGDALLTLPLADEFKRRFPGARLAVLTLEKTADVFRARASIDEVLIDDKRGQNRGLGGLRLLARRLRQERFDAAIIPHRSFRSALLARLSGIPRRVGFSSSAGSFLLTDRVPWTWLMPDAERNLALLKPLGGGHDARAAAAAPESVYLRPDPAEKEKMARALDTAGTNPGRTFVGVHPGSAWPTKRWPEERFAALCRGLSERGFTPVLVGGPQDRELCARVAAQSGAQDFCGKTDLKELKALLSFFPLFITNDSGPMHMAAGLGVPTLAVFGPTTRELGFFPYGPRHRVLEADLTCRPCRLHGGKACPHGHFLCMRLIMTDEVLETALEMLAQKPPAAAAKAGGRA
ncbi:MAG: lipopolysaccharide heptosyltransferase II, partial [Elusimicrobia bacterium]|nr:lipopolysaccharide heptosyltransferase II [Elusimicrobiota bacterium]